MNNADAHGIGDLLDDDLPTDVFRVGLELKFAVPEAKAHELVASLATMLEPDPYTGPAGEYDVMSLYLDTPELDAYRRTVEHKWRVRRYGSSFRLFAELKAKPESGRVVKRRTEFDSFLLPRLVDRDGPAKWFSKQIFVTTASRRFVGSSRLSSKRRCSSRGPSPRTLLWAARTLTLSTSNERRKRPTSTWP